MTEKAMVALKVALVSAGIPSVFIGDLPSQKTECVAIRPVDGYASTRYFGKTTIEEPLVEVLVRANNYQLGQEWYTKASKALDNFVSPDSGILRSNVTGSPGYLGKDVTGYGEWHFLIHVSLQP